MSNLGKPVFILSAVDIVPECVRLVHYRAAKKERERGHPSFVNVLHINHQYNDSSPWKNLHSQTRPHQLLSIFFNDSRCKTEIGLYDPQLIREKLYSSWREYAGRRNTTSTHMDARGGHFEKKFIVSNCKHARKLVKK